MTHVIERRTGRTLRQILTILDDNLAAPNCDYHIALQFVRSVVLLKLRELEKFNRAKQALTAWEKIGAGELK